MTQMLQPDLEAMPPAERAALQFDRLVGLIRRLQKSESPYWQDKLRDVDPDGLRGIEDISRLPFTVKAELRDTYPFGMLAVPLQESIRIHASSGTQGKPTVVAYTEADIDLFAEVNARSIACAGGRPDDVLHVAYGYGLFTGGLGLHYGGERLGATVVPASGGNAGFQVQMLADLGAAGLACTPSFAMLLAERAAADDMLEQIHLRYGVHGAEPWSESFRRKLENAWSGQYDACDIYGLSEVIGPGVAMECREGKGALHVFDDHFFPEVIDLDTLEPAADGVYGELVLTTLTKEALPVIRYRTGDVTRFVGESCPCSRTHRRIARFTGRVDDMLVIRGVNVFPSEIEAAVLDDPALGGQYAIVIDRTGTLPELEVRAEVTSPEFMPRREEIAGRLRERLAQRLRLRVQAIVGGPETIPRQETGKARRVFERTADQDPFPGHAGPGSSETG
jgi:phenylacetate-CoA ligase